MNSLTHLTNADLGCLPPHAASGAKSVARRSIITLFWVACALVIAQPRTEAAQPTNINYICASNGVGGIQTSADDDVGQVVLHTTVGANVLNGRHYVHLDRFGSSGRDALLEVTDGVVTYG